ncbi:MAG: urea transport system permease protein, partial [Loktanella salsilacus]
MLRILAALILSLGFASLGQAQDLQPVLQSHASEIAKPSRSSVSTALDALVASGLPQVTPFLEAWTDKGIWQRDADGVFFYGSAKGSDLTLRDVDTDAETVVTTNGYTELRPNGGVRRVIGTALVQFQLSDPDITRRLSAIDSIARRPDA